MEIYANVVCHFQADSGVLDFLEAGSFGGDGVEAGL